MNARANGIDRNLAARVALLCVWEPSAYADAREHEAAELGMSPEELDRALALARGASPSSGTLDTWPEPIDFLGNDAMTGPPILGPDHVPEVVWRFASDTAERMGVDPATVALSAIVTCASVVSDGWRVQPKRRDDTWTEAPRLWGAIVGDPSVLKSPVIAAATKPIDRLDTEAREAHVEAMRRHKAAHVTWKAEGAKQGEPEPVPPRMDRYLVEGTTVEALTEVLRDDPEARFRTPAGKVLVRQDELAEWVGSMDRYAGGKGGDRGAWLRAYNGGRQVIDRVGRGSFPCPNWSVCILGGIQPGPIQRIASNTSDDGLLQRFLFVVPGPNPEGVDREPNRDALDLYAGTIRALATMHPPAHGRPVALAEASQPHRERTEGRARALAAMPDTGIRMRAALGKVPGLFARLAITFHLIEAAACRASGAPTQPLDVVQEATAARAARFLEAIALPHLRRADAVMYSTPQDGHAAWVAGFILSKRLASIQDRGVVQAYGALRSPERRQDRAEVMASLVTMGWLREVPPKNLAKPASEWTVNPLVHDRFASRAEAERVRRERIRDDLRDRLAG